MSIQRAREYLERMGCADRIIEPEASTATVPLAAQALGTTEGEIAKTLSFLVDGEPVLILMAGDGRVQNRKFKDTFHTKAKMIPPEDVEDLVGHEPGGVCPFGVLPGVAVYLDQNLKAYEFVYPAAGNDHSGVRLTPDELYRVSGAAGWVDVCR